MYLDGNLLINKGFNSIKNPLLLHPLLPKFKQITPLQATVVFQWISIGIGRHFKLSRASQQVGFD